MITITALRRVPPFAQGVVRDLRARWALEEAGLPHRAELLSIEQIKAADYLERQPFGQVPVLEDGEVRLFESGAIALHVAEQSEILLPRDRQARARATAWVFAALNSVEVAIQPLAEIDLFHAQERWAQEKRPQAEKFVQARLDALAAALGDRDYLEGSTFTVGDLMMISVLRILRFTDLVKKMPALARYVARGEARPAFQRALAAQLAAFEAW